MRALETTGPRLAALLREHRWFVALLGVAFLLRLATAIAYQPLLMELTDAWAYLSLSYDFDVDTHFLAAPDRPFGYPLLLWLLALPAGFNPEPVVVLQHLAGLVTGTFAYAALVRLGVRRWLALAAAGVILLDTYAIALEHSTLPEPWFTAGLMVAAVLAATRPSPWALFAAGLTLGLATSLRLVALVAIPIWALYVIWRYWGQLRLVGLALVGLALPVSAYATVHAASTGEVGFADASGIFLYARVAHLADCSQMDVEPAARPLCQPESERVDNPSVYVWEPDRSPARLMFPGWGSTVEEQSARDQFVGDFARETIRSQPLAYLGLVARDFSYFFRPAADLWASETALRLPPSGSPLPGDLARATWPEYRLEADFPAPVLHALWHVLRTPRWLLGPLSLLALSTIAVGLVSTIRRRPRHLARVKETFLFAGMGLATLLAAAATAQFGLRYLVAVAPLLIVAGALAIEDSSGALRALRSRSPTR